MSKEETYTKEQIEEMKDFFRKNDFTTDMAVERKCSLEGKEAEVFVKSKNIFSGYWHKILRFFDIKRIMSNFSKDHPINFIQNADADHFSEIVAKIMTDKDPNISEKYLEKYFEMYEEPLTIGFKGYAQQQGKELDDLTDEEIKYVVDKVNDVINEELIKVVMYGQQVPEMYGISHEVPQHEDFTSDLTDDKINFHNKWNHSKTMTGAPVMFGDLSEEEMEKVDSSRSVFNLDDPNDDEFVKTRDSFVDTLDETDRKIFELKEQGYTQEEIASQLGYKTHSAVTKRLAVIKENFKEYFEIA